MGGDIELNDMMLSLSGFLALVVYPKPMGSSNDLTALHRSFSVRGLRDKI